MASSATAASGTIVRGLIQATAHSAVAYAAGQPAGATATAAALALAEGAIRAMNVTKWATMILLAVCLSGATVALGLAGYHGLAGLRPAEAAALGAPSPGQDQAKQKSKSDAQRLLGIWRITKGVGDGKDLPAEFTTLARLKFVKDGELKLTVAGQFSSDGKYELVGPGKINIALRPGEDLGHGIYRFDGDDRLTICSPKEGEGQRPDDFTAANGSGRVLLTLQRAKAGEEKPTDAEIAKFGGPVDRVREAVARNLSANNLKQIGIAMHNYHDAHNALPLHAIYGKDGKTPLLSWRVAILPYIDNGALYKEFKLDERWDSPHNKKLIPKMPKLYEVGIGKAGEGQTYYQVFMGSGTVFDGTKKVMFKDIARGTDQTALAVEATEPVIWTKPADVTLPADKDMRPAVGGLFSNGFHVLLCNGGVVMMARTASTDLIRSVAKIKDGD
jgi:uncharacterized protein (TIGR03067 family)